MRSSILCKSTKMESFRQCLYVIVCLLFMLRGIVCDDGEANPLEFSTKDCTLIEPVYRHKFDFTGLRSDLAHQATSADGEKFEFNICGKLSRSCGGQNNAAACLKRKDNKEYVLGLEHTLKYKNGKMYFEYNGGAKCNTDATRNFTLHVTLSCDYTLDKDPVRVTQYAKDTCSFYVSYETPAACLPEPDAVKSNQCSVRDAKTGHTFDLLPLSDENHITTDHSGSAFIINVCKPVLYGQDAMCPIGSSVCFVSLKATDYKKKFFDYGTVQANPIYEDGKLLMRHTSLTKCNSTTNYTSVINFFCDKNVRNSHPEMASSSDCHYKFTWFTPLACNDLEPCTAVTHGSGVIDMRTLANKPVTLQHEGKNFTFDVCSAAGTPCLEDDGACAAVNDQSSSFGKFNSHLRYNQTGSAYLLYENGAACAGASSNSNLWSTKIEFICGNNTKSESQSTAENNLATIVEIHNCQLLIHYQTELACQEKITCKVKPYADAQTMADDDSVQGELDLSPLINAHDNYEAEVDESLLNAKKVDAKTKFYLNVCRPLVPKFGLGCPGGSAGCMAKKIDGSTTPEEEQSLGYPMVSLTAINGSAAELRYVMGSVCPTDKNSTLSMGIGFYCDQRAGRGRPVLREISDCHYQFAWASNVICPAHQCNFDVDSCEIHNPHINVSYNLKKAPYTDDLGRIKAVQEDNSEFWLSTCGLHRIARTDYSQGLVNLYFMANGTCDVNRNQINVQMRIVCSAETSHVTHFTKDMQCSFTYEQRTPDICKFLGLEVPPNNVPSTTPKPATTIPAKPTDNGKTTTSTKTTQKSSTDENQATNKTGNVGTILAAILSVTCFVSCLAIFALSPQRRNAVRRLFRRSSSAVRYSRVQSNEEANLLLEPNGEFTDSDDDMLL